MKLLLITCAVAVFIIAAALGIAVAAMWEYDLDMNE